MDCQKENHSLTIKDVEDVWDSLERKSKEDIQRRIEMASGVTTALKQIRSARVDNRITENEEYLASMRVQWGVPLHSSMIDKILGRKEKAWKKLKGNRLIS